MDIGLAYIFLTALAWTGVGCGYSAAARRGLRMTPFVATVATVAALLNAAVSTRWAMWPGWGAALPVVVVIAASGAIGQWGMLLSGVAMRVAPRHSAATWAVLQMAMVVPFLSATLTGREYAFWYNWAGLPLILTAAVLVLTPQNTQDDESAPNDRLWLAVLLAAFASNAISQTLAQEISLRHWADTANLRACVAMAAAGVTLWLVTLVRRQFPSLQCLVLGALTGCLAAASAVVLYRALDVCAALGRAYIVFPVAVGGTISLFTAYQIVTGREPCELRKLGGLAIGIAGVALLSIR